PEDDLVEWARQEDICLVLANGIDPLMRLSSVAPANFFGAYMATKHLLDAGHRKILHYTYRNRHTILQRRRGFEAAMASVRDAIPTVVISNEHSSKELLEDLRDGKYDVTAAFCWNDSVAVSMVETLLGQDADMPASFSLMGFDDL